VLRNQKANFTQAGATSAVAAAASSGDPQLEATARALAGLPQLEVTKKQRKSRRGRNETKTAPKVEATPTPTATATPAPTATAEPTDEQKTDTLLDYLFGGDG